MVVTLLYRGLRIAGLHVGVQNARRFFPPDTPAIELRLDHVSILCPLSPHFWEDRAEICDPRLCGWLESKFSYRSTARSVPHLTLLPTSPGVYRLTSLNLALASTPDAALSGSASV